MMALVFAFAGLHSALGVSFPTEVRPCALSPMYSTLPLFPSFLPAYTIPLPTVYTVEVRIIAGAVQ